MTRISCVGWWEQFAYGRQTMDDLWVEFDGTRLRGAGTDIVGPFTLQGEVREGGVVIVKWYVGAHAVQYVGMYDGEGTFQGIWRIGFDEGNWCIRLMQEQSHGGIELNEVQEITSRRIR